MIFDPCVMLTSHTATAITHVWPHLSSGTGTCGPPTTPGAPLSIPIGQVRGIAVHPTTQDVYLVDRYGNDHP
jgi:hypothetical protein